MDRVSFIMEALSISKIRALIIDNLIKSIPDNKMIDFFTYRLNYADEKMSIEAITKKALFEFRKKITEERIKRGEKVFENIEDLKSFLTTYYTNREITNCGEGSNWYSCVIIGLDKENNFINKYATTEYNTFIRLNASEEVNFLKWLLDNQDRIGKIDYNEVLRGENELKNKKHTNTPQIEKVSKNESKEAISLQEFQDRIGLNQLVEQKRI